MGIVHPSSEGVPGGLSADGQRTRMVGCGAPSSSVSRLSPSIPRIFLVKRLRRYSASSLLTHCCSLHAFVLCTSFRLCSTQPHLHARHTNMHSLSNKLFPLWIRDLGSRSSYSVLIHPKNSTLAYYNWPCWLCSQPEDGEPLLCAFSLKLFFSFHHFRTTSLSLLFLPTTSPPFSFSIGLLPFQKETVLELHTGTEVFIYKAKISLMLTNIIQQNWS